MKLRPMVVGLCLASLVAVPASAASTDPAAACAAAKRKAVGRQAFDKLRCHATAAKEGGPVEPRCLDRADTRLSQAFARAELQGGCVTLGDAATLAAQVDTFIGGIVAVLPKVCQAGGQQVGGHCWYLGTSGQSCDQTCAAAGQAYDVATQTFAGSEGSDAACVAVLQALVASWPSFSSQDCDASGWGALGCWALPPFFLNTWSFQRCAAPPTTADASASVARRACACL